MEMEIDVTNSLLHFLPLRCIELRASSFHTEYMGLSLDMELNFHHRIRALLEIILQL